MAACSTRANLPLLRRFRLRPATRTGEFDESLKIERHACYGVSADETRPMMPEVCANRIE
jgi:hypothetical protein